MLDTLRERLDELVHGDRGTLVIVGAIVALVLLGWWGVSRFQSASNPAPAQSGKPLPALKEMGYRFYDPIAKEIFVIPAGPDVSAVYTMASGKPRTARVPSPLSSNKRVGICAERCMGCGEFFAPKYYTESKLQPDSPGAFVCPACDHDNARDYAPREEPPR